MISDLNMIHNNLSFNTGVIINAIDGLDDETAMKKISDNANNANWVLGHLVTSRYVLLGLAGVCMEFTSWGKLYGRGVAFDPVNEYLSLSEIKKGCLRS